VCVLFVNCLCSLFVYFCLERKKRKQGDKISVTVLVCFWRENFNTKSRLHIRALIKINVARAARAYFRQRNWKFQNNMFGVNASN